VKKQSGDSSCNTQGDISGMFNDISNSYDSLNHLLSFGIDRYWRRRFAALIKLSSGETLIDIATGTGDIPLLIAHTNSHIIGVDPSAQMLVQAAQKLHTSIQAGRLQLIEAPVEALPLADNTADIVSVSFGLRNFSDMGRGLSEIHRVLKPGGRCLILEFSLPRNPVYRSLYIFYLTGLLPLIGGIISGNIRAYRYLHRSIIRFAIHCNVCQQLTQAGFTHIHKVPITLGVVSVYMGEKTAQANGVLGE